MSNSKSKNNSTNNCNNASKSKIDNSNSQKESLGLEKFSYADFVLLSSTIAYAIAEELNEADLQLLLGFMGMISSDLAILTIKQGLNKAKTNVDIETTVENIAEENVSTQLVRKKNINNKKKVKKVKSKIL